MKINHEFEDKDIVIARRIKGANFNVIELFLSSGETIELTKDDILALNRGVRDKGE